MKILFIDTIDNDEAVFGLFLDGKILRQKSQSLPHAEVFASHIKKFLQKSKINFSELDKIAVKVGPGFFSRVRTGVVSANALGFALQIPVVPVRGQFDFSKIAISKGQQFARPVYSAPPNITKPKKRK